MEWPEHMVHLALRAVFWHALHKERLDCIRWQRQPNGAVHAAWCHVEHQMPAKLALPNTG
jgi:hypothetical protein